MGVICEAYGVRTGLLLGGTATVVAAVLLAGVRAWRHRAPDPEPALVGRASGS
jgi:hypothetical protein